MDPNPKASQRAYTELIEILTAAALLFLIFANVVSHLQDTPDGRKEQKRFEAGEDRCVRIQQTRKDPFSPYEEPRRSSPESGWFYETGPLWAARGEGSWQKSQNSQREG